MVYSTDLTNSTSKPSRHLVSEMLTFTDDEIDAQAKHFLIRALERNEISNHVLGIGGETSAQVVCIALPSLIKEISSQGIPLGEQTAILMQVAFLSGIQLATKSPIKAGAIVYETNKLGGGEHVDELIRSLVVPVILRAYELALKRDGVI